LKLLPAARPSLLTICIGTEIITHGKNRIYSRKYIEAVEALQTINRINRDECRTNFEIILVQPLWQKIICTYEKLLFTKNEELTQLSIHK